MSTLHPNHLHVHSGETSIGYSFGEVRSVNPVHFCGLGHHPHLEIRCQGGLRIDVTPQFLIALLREAQQALAKLPYPPDIHDHVGDQE